MHKAKIVGKIVYKVGTNTFSLNGKQVKVIKKQHNCSTVKMNGNTLLIPNSNLQTIN